MKELLNQLAIASDELHKAAVELVNHKEFDRANRCTWAAKTIENWSTDIFFKGGQTDEQKTI